MERIRPTLFLFVIVAGALLAACGGGTAPTGTWTPQAPLPDLRPDSTAVVVKPHALAFAGIGKKFAKKIVVSEKAYSGKFVEHGTCKGVAKALPLSGSG
ncbi:MAG TPA: hypothetical protein VKB39_05260, partial [Candidatus Baltobacteraceae bacterium]|nr:hypothetical protein [Candidatus Baltobacteraceae bacterium]